VARGLNKFDALAALGRRHITRFAAMYSYNYKPEWFHWVVGDHLQAVIDGACKRLIVCMPPRHGKSELCSRHFPPYYLGLRNGEERSIIASSYNTHLARTFGRSARNITRSMMYQQIFRTTLAKDSGTAASDWALDNGNAYVAAGVNGGVTGLGASVFLVDDPIKDRKQANSAVYRESLKDWFKEVALTRLTPNGSIVIIMTRWHHDDLVGWLLANGEADEWIILKFPAIRTEESNGDGQYEYDIREPGEALWPRWRFPQLRKKMVETHKRWNEDAVLIESKASGKDLLYALQDETNLPVQPVNPVVDKISRASAVSGRFEAGRVHVPISAPWLNAYLTEMEHFPAGGFDDQVDSTTQAIRWLSRYAGAAADSA